MTLSIDERDQLRSTARDLLSRQATPEQVRAVVATDEGFDRDLWTRMVELGWTAIHLPEDDGGAGCSYVDLGVVLHELGRSIVPSPLLASAVLAGSAVSGAANSVVRKELLPSIATGELIASVALAEPSGSYATEHISVRWEGWADSVRLNGLSAYVLDGDLADVLIVVARDEAGAVAVFAVPADAPGISVQATPPVDQTRRLFSVAFDDVTVPSDRLLCEPGGDAESLVGHVLAVGAVAAACDSVGVAEVALERATEYASERQQFGKLIGSFQAVKHRCADMAIAVEASRAAVGGALTTLQDDPSGSVREAAITSSYVGPACSNACGLALLVHGGIGFTWEHDSHLYLKRAKLSEVLFGTPSWHRRRLADDVFPELVGNQSHEELGARR